MGTTIAFQIKIEAPQILPQPKRDHRSRLFSLHSKLSDLTNFFKARNIFFREADEKRRGGFWVHACFYILMGNVLEIFLAQINFWQFLFGRVNVTNALAEMKIGNFEKMAQRD